eukprot:12416991-Karenia_brevis.AAC.1
MPCLHSSAVDALNMCLLSITRPLTCSRHQSLASSTLQVKTWPFQGYSTFKCRTQLAALATVVNTQHN